MIGKKRIGFCHVIRICQISKMDFLRISLFQGNLGNIIIGCYLFLIVDFGCIYCVTVRTVNY